MNRKRIILFVALLNLLPNLANAQYIEDRKIAVNNIAVPFLLLSTDAISSGMGESGSALIGEVANIESGISKIVHADQRLGGNITYTPWLRRLVNDRKLMYAGGFYRVSENLSLMMSINYLSYGQIQGVDDNNIDQGNVVPSEFVVGLGASKRFGPNFSIGLKAKLINSKMFDGSSNNLSMQLATGYGVDLSVMQLFRMPKLPEGSSLAVALNVMNIGPKLSYFQTTEQKYSLPTSLKIGTALKLNDLAENTFMLAIDVSKLMVSSSEIAAGKSVMQGIVSSFDGRMILQDIGYSIGAGYTFKKRISFRMGYNLQDNDRLMGSFFSLGTGFVHKNTSLNISYITGNQQKTFLSNTMRISLAFAVL